MNSYLTFVERLARTSGQLIMGHYNQGVAVDYKGDDTPVTVADREAEAFLRGEIEKAYPTHQVVGEEAGTSGGGANFKWILDPIDGTKSFVHGVPLFGTLIALLEGDEPVLGAIHLPAQGQLLLGAKGRLTTLNGQPVRVSQTARLEEACVLFTSPTTLFDLGYEPLFQGLRKRARLVRSWGDCFGHFQVATGRAEAMIDPVLNLWDVAPMKPILEGAGGRMTDMEGRPAGTGASALSTNGPLHEELLRLAALRLPQRGG